MNELRRFIHGNSVDRHIIRKFVDAVFGKAATSDANAVVATDLKFKTYREVALSIETMVSQLDMPVRIFADAGAILFLLAALKSSPAL